MVGDELYHHIINPNTLMPERYSRSVSIATSDPALADLYSTAIFTMTIEDGLAFVNSIDGLEAIWYTMDDTIVMSDNFEADYLYEAYVPVDTNYN
jgi:thiamine biosynthesis lipoprotein